MATPSKKQVDASIAILEANMKEAAAYDCLSAVEEYAKAIGRLKNLFPAEQAVRVGKRKTEAVEA